jgi:hypothetical protein
MDFVPVNFDGGPGVLRGCNGKHVRYYDRRLAIPIYGGVRRVFVSREGANKDLSSLTVKDRRFNFLITTTLYNISSLEVEDA